MATTLTPEDIQTIAKQVYQMIITGQANSISYTKSVEAPTDPDEQQLWVVPAIKNPDDKQSRVAGNMGLRNILEAFGNEAMTQNTIATQNIATMTNLKETAEKYATGKIDGQPIESDDPAYQNNAAYFAQQIADDKTHVDTVKEQIDAIKTAIDGQQNELEEYVADTLKPELDSHAEDKQTAFDQHVAGKQTDFNENASTKTTTFNQNATQKQESFNSNVTQKTDAAEQAIADAKNAAIEQIQAAMVSITLGESDYEAL